MEMYIAYFVGLAFMFAACNKCKECTLDDYEYEIYNDNTGEYETYGDYIQEVCSDNFESIINYIFANVRIRFVG